jgi:hypothetical protein
MPLVEAVYADSATHDIKFINPTLVTQIRALEEQINQIKSGLVHGGKEDTFSYRVARFIDKWGGNGLL